MACMGGRFILYPQLTSLAHISLASFLWDIGTNWADPDLTPQYAASDQGLHCLLTE